MCTLTIAWRAFSDAPIAVAANRDEAIDRPSRPPERWTEGVAADLGMVAPRDERAGGTWIGYNASGVFAGLSNRWTDHALPAERSRGLLVVDALAHPSAADAVRAVESALSDARYAGFNLLVADADAAVLLEWDGELRLTDLEPGVHVVMNAGFDDRFRPVPGRTGEAARQAESAAAVRARLAVGSGETVSEWLDRAGTVLGDHDVGVCVHGDGFGTRSSSLIALRADGSAAYRFADGPPCETAFESIDAGTG